MVQFLLFNDCILPIDAKSPPIRSGIGGLFIYALERAQAFILWVQPQKQAQFSVDNIAIAGQTLYQKHSSSLLN